MPTSAMIFPPVAQLDNAADSDSEERGFESLQAGQNRQISTEVCRFYFFTLNSSLFTILFVSVSALPTNYKNTQWFKHIDKNFKLLRICTPFPKNRLAFASLFFYPLRKQWYIINKGIAFVVSHHTFRCA